MQIADSKNFHRNMIPQREKINNKNAGVSQNEQIKKEKAHKKERGSLAPRPLRFA